MKRVWLEAGGKSANIVFADCPDLQQAASATAAGIFYNQGQVCIAGMRPSPEESIADEFLALLKQQAQNWQPGHPLDPATTMGTLIDCAHADSVHSFIREGESKGQLLLDGRNAGLAAAIGPTIFVDVDPNASLSRENILVRCWWSRVSHQKNRRYSLPTTASTALARRYGRATSPARTA